MSERLIANIYKKDDDVENISYTHSWRRLQRLSRAMNALLSNASNARHSHLSHIAFTAWFWSHEYVCFSCFQLEFILKFIAFHFAHSHQNRFLMRFIMRRITFHFCGYFKCIPLRLMGTVFIAQLVQMFTKTSCILLYLNLARTILFNSSANSVRRNISWHVWSAVSWTLEIAEKFFP